MNSETWDRMVEAERHPENRRELRQARRAFEQDRPAEREEAPFGYDDEGNKIYSTDIINPK